MMRRLILSTLVVVFALLFQPLRAAAQQITTGVIQGSVADATGASLPGVNVEARNVDTNFARTLVTEPDGRFVLLQLPPGRYRVTFTLAGFATLVQENIVLTVGQAVTAAGGDEGVGRRRDGDRHDRDRRRRDHAHGVGEHARREDDRVRRRFSGASSRTC